MTVNGMWREGRIYPHAKPSFTCCVAADGCDDRLRRDRVYVPWSFTENLPDGHELFTRDEEG